MKVQIIVGSTRPIRNGLLVAEWIADNLPVYPGMTYEIIDLAEINLPLLDEPNLASQDKYLNNHTKKWSSIAKSADAFVWLTPEYNAGYSAAIKNAIDYLYNEWIERPVIIASYGYHGGESAASQLLKVAQRLKMKPTATPLLLQFTYEMLDETGKFNDVAESFKQYLPNLEIVGDELHKLLKSDA